MWHFRHSKNLRYGLNCTQCIVHSVFHFTGVILEIPHCTNFLANYVWTSTGVWYLSSTCQSEMHHSFVFREGLCAKIMSGHNAPPGAYIAAESIWRRDWVCSQAPLVAECQFSGKVRNEFLSVLAIIPRSSYWYFSWQNLCLGLVRVLQKCCFVVTRTAHRGWYFTYFEFLGGDQIKWDTITSLIYIVLTLFLSCSKLCTYIFLYHLLVRPPPLIGWTPRNVAELGKMVNHCMYLFVAQT